MIGAGWMGAAIAGDFTLCDEVHLAALGARDRRAGVDFAEQHDISEVLSVDDLLGRDDLDVIYIATPHNNHRELALAAIDAGLSVLVEKSFTTTEAEAVEVAEAAASAGVFLMEAMWMRFNPAVREILALLDSGAIGEPRTVQASFGFPVPQGNHRLWDPLRAGGSLLDQGVYPLSLAQLVFGEPATVAAVGSTRDYLGDDAGVDTELGMLLGYDGGQQAVLSTSIRAMLPLTAAIGGAEGLIELAEAFWSDTTYTVRRPGGSSEARTVPREGNGYVPMLRAVHEAVASEWREHPLCTVAESVTLMRTTDRVRAALRQAPEAGVA